MTKKQIEKSEKVAAKSRREVFTAKKNSVSENRAAKNSRENCEKNSGQKATPEQMRKIQSSLFSAAVFATVRLTLPVMILFALGLVVDKILNQFAFFAILGAVLGFVIGGYLVSLQIKKINSRSEKKIRENPAKNSENSEKGGEK